MNADRHCFPVKKFCSVEVYRPKGSDMCLISDNRTREYFSSNMSRQAFKVGRLERKVARTMAKSHKLVLSSVVLLAITCFQTFTGLTFAAVVGCIGFMATKIRVNLASSSFLVLISLLSLGFYGLFLSSLVGVPDEALKANFKVFIIYPIISFLFISCFRRYNISDLFLPLFMFRSSQSLFTVVCSFL